jgi:hypothetical protein
MGNSTTQQLTIDDIAQGYAKVYSSLLIDEYQRKRAYASIAALYAFLKLLEKSSCEVQKSMTLFRNPKVNEQYEITDLYVNKWHLDVRVVVDDDFVLVPKLHFDCDIVPDFYVVIRVDKDVKNAELLGFAPATVPPDKSSDKKYYSISLSSLISYDEFLEKVKDKKDENFTEDEHEFFSDNYLGLIDNELSTTTKNRMIKHLFECSKCRTEFCCFTGFEMVCCNSSKYPNLLSDHTLGYIGAENVNKKKYNGKELTIDISNNGENVSNILDELFTLDDDVITEEDSEKENKNDFPTSIDDIDIDNVDINDLDDSLFMDVENNSVSSISTEPFEKLDDIDEEDIIEEENDNNQINDSNNETQKVVSDIDENGNPVYSYVNNVDKDNVDIIDSTVIETLEEESKPQEKPIEEFEVLEEFSEIDDEELQEFEDNENNNIINEETTPDESTTIEETSIEDFTTEEDKFLDNMQSHQPSNDEFLPNDDILEDETSSTITNEDLNNTENTQNEVFDIELEEDTDEETSQSEEMKELESSNEEEFPEAEFEEEEFAEIAEEEFEEYDENEENEGNDEDTTNSNIEDDNGVFDSEKLLNDKSNNSKLVLIAVSVVVGIGLASSGLFLILKNNKFLNEESKTIADTNSIEMQEEVNPVDDMFSNDTLATMDETQSIKEKKQNLDELIPTKPKPVEPTVKPITEDDLVEPIRKASSNGDLNKALVNAFPQMKSGASFRGLNWVCSSDLFSDKGFKKFLQNLDNTLKQNIKNNIVDTIDTPKRDSVSAKFAVDNNGNLIRVKISDSSGSTEIDNIVLQSIKESFEGEKSPIIRKGKLKSDMYFLKVVIKL